MNYYLNQRKIWIDFFDWTLHMMKRKAQSLDGRQDLSTVMATQLDGCNSKSTPVDKVLLDKDDDDDPCLEE